MHSNSGLNNGGSYHTTNSYGPHKSRFGRLSSAAFLVGTIALLTWAFAPLTSDTNYIAVSTAKISLNPASSLKSTLDNQDNIASSTTALRTFKAEDTLGSFKLKQSSASLPLELTQDQEHSSKEKTPLRGSIKSFVVKSGDTLSKIFQEAGIPLVLAIKLNQTETAGQIRSLMPGREMRFFFSPEGQWETLEYTLDKLRTLVIRPKQDSFKITEHEKAVTYEMVVASGTINSSIGIAGEQAGLSYNMVSKLVDIFKWEIDFARDIQSGDRFHMIYQKAYVGNDFIDDGEILAAEFWNRGGSIQAVRYENTGGEIAYYKPDGESLKRGFLRTPVMLGRVTSGFSKRRLHPIKRTWKAHKGVDYGAKRGTPILATGDGVVQYAGKKGGYGSTVVLRHGGQTTTLYAHMNKFGKGIRTGKRVIQGQTIGYVGSTGWATGPHLHYEFRINGRHRNPLKVEFPRTDPVAASEMAEFRRESKQRLIQLSNSVEIKTAQR